MTPIISIHWQFYYGKIPPQGKIEREIWDISVPMYTRIYRRLCLARVASNSRKEMSPAHGDLYIRFVRECEILRHIGHQTQTLDSANGQVRSRFAPYFSMNLRCWKKYVKNVISFLSPMSIRNSREFTHSASSRRWVFPFSAISRLFLPVKHWRLFPQDSVSNVEILLPCAFGMRLLFALALHEF